MRDWVKFTEEEVGVLRDLLYNAFNRLNKGKNEGGNLEQAIEVVETVLKENE